MRNSTTCFLNQKTNFIKASKELAQRERKHYKFAIQSNRLCLRNIEFLKRPVHLLKTQ